MYRGISTSRRQMSKAVLPWCRERHAGRSVAVDRRSNRNDMGLQWGRDLLHRREYQWADP